MRKKMILGDTDANRELFGNNDNVKFVSRGCGSKLAEIIESYII